ncbi:ZSWIM8 [Cordylochernes scorpioides]|uniref:ZSWIM8 n=1 Tax=Cordylochernes scorpioides TaxID=51811 RepID=A0ABY6JXS7_9ARAC|nr:ZSWIM8 [Cordylochernes scorpioides]
MASISVAISSLCLPLPSYMGEADVLDTVGVAGQAMEIGTAALHFLMETWEGHLTPPEVASLADRASRGRDPSLVRAAADLALSCLPHAQALNPNEIQRALIQCKEQSGELLERACLAVEAAAKGGGVYPEVLFEVAKKWYELYNEGVSGEEPVPRPPVTTEAPIMMENVITTVQIACPPPPVSYTLAYPAFGGPYLAYVPATTAYQYGTLAYYPSTHHHLRPLYPPSTSPPRPSPHSPGVNQQRISYLLAAYRVGMLAMDTLARRVHDDRPQAKYSRNPPYGEDVKWLLAIAKKLGPSYLQDFCICTVNSVASPFILHELILDAAPYLAGQPMRSHYVTPLIQKCQQMFIACAHFKMYHITAGEYDEFVNIIRAARSAFQLTPGGHVQFNEFLQSIRRSKSCKKDLWQRIANTLAPPPI